MSAESGAAIRVWSDPTPFFFTVGEGETRKRVALRWDHGFEDYEFSCPCCDRLHLLETEDVRPGADGGITLTRPWTCSRCGIRFSITDGVAVERVA